jgi:hypothetical protein
VRFSNLHSDARSTEPVKLFPLISRVVKLVSRNNDSGIGPTNWFVERTNSCNAGTVNRDVGISPVENRVKSPHLLSRDRNYCINHRKINPEYSSTYFLKPDTFCRLHIEPRRQKFFGRWILHCWLGTAAGHGRWSLPSLGNIGTFDPSPNYLLLPPNRLARCRCVRCLPVPTTAGELSAGLPVTALWTFALALPSSSRCRHPPAPQLRTSPCRTPPPDMSVASRPLSSTTSTAPASTAESHPDLSTGLLPSPLP